MSDVVVEQPTAGDPPADEPSRSGDRAGRAVTVAVHQPNYLPYIGFFYKMASSDVFIFLDDAQYVRRGFCNRNRVKTPQGVTWLTVPVNTKGKYYATYGEIMPQWESGWTTKHMRTLQHCYKRAPYYDEVTATILEPVFARVERERPDLAELNIALVTQIRDYLGMRTAIQRSSQYGVGSSSTQRLVDLVRLAGGGRYLSGSSGRDYIDPDLFRDAGLELAYSDFSHPTYAQQGSDFQANLSILDSLFNCGPTVELTAGPALMA